MDRSKFQLSLILMALCLVSVFLIACLRNEVKPDDKPFISMQVDSCVKYSNDSISIENFIFSPLDSNVIWIFNGNGKGGTCELRLTDSSWTPLSARWGKYSYGLREECVIKDSVDGNLLWIANFHNGLIAYDISLNKYTAFDPIKPVSSTYFDTNMVFIGSWEGLYLIDRDNMKASKSKSIAEIHVRKIEKLNKDILLINNKYEFDYRKDRILKTRDDIIIDLKQLKVVPEISYNDAYIILKKKNEDGSYSNEYFTFNKPVMNLRFDTKYVYLNTWHSFEIYNRSYLFRVSHRVNNPTIDKKAFDSVIHSLQMQHMDFPDYYRTVKRLKERYKNTEVRYIRQEINQLATHLRYHFDPRGFNEIIKNEKFIHDSVTEDTIKAAYYLRVIFYANFELKLNESLKYDAILKDQLPQFRSDDHKRQMEIVADYYNKTERTKNSPDLSADEVLWKLGSDYFEFYPQVVLTHPEITYPDMSYPFHFLDKLVARYPDSKYADNARFLVLRFNELASHDHGDNSYNLEAIEEYKSILKKYPDTEHAAEIYHIISELYSYLDVEFSDVKFSEIPKYYRLALNYADKVLNEYPLYEKREEVIELKKHIFELLSSALWRLDVQSDKTVYALNEPINITFKLTNIGSNPKTIRVWKDKGIPNFFLRVSRYDLDPESNSNHDARTEEDPLAFDHDRIDITIDPNEDLTQTFDITRRALNDWNGPMIRFITETPGRYYIQTYGSESGYDLAIPGNDVWITVK